MYFIFFWILLFLFIIVLAFFHIRTHKYNLANRNLIIGSMYKDTWPYRIMRGILFFIFLFLFFCYKPIVVPDIDYVDSIKLTTVDNRLEQSLGVAVCKLKDLIDKSFCTEEEKLYGCDDNPVCDSCTGYICGVLDVIISGGSLLPVSGFDTIFTMDDGQTDMTFDIYQGDNIIAGKNTLLQSGIVIDGLPDKLAGNAGVKISFNVDRRGYLSFKIVDKDNNYNSTKGTVLIPNNGYIVVPEGDISVFEYLKRRLGLVFNWNKVE